MTKQDIIIELITLFDQNKLTEDDFEHYKTYYCICEQDIWNYMLSVDAFVSFVNRKHCIY